MDTTVPLLIGALIGFLGSFGGAMLTTAMSRLQKEREMHGQVQRKAREIKILCSRYSDIDQHVREADKVDSLANDIDALIFLFLSRADRRDLRTCTTAILARSSYGPNPTQSSWRAAVIIEAIVSARAAQPLPLLHDSELSTWVRSSLRSFCAQAELDEENQRLIAEEQERQQRGDVP